MVLNQNQTGCKEELFYYEGGETLEEVTQRGGMYHIPGNLQGRIGQGSEQPGLAEHVPAYCREAGLDDLQRPSANHIIL